jgi:hypothetical protein
MRALLVVSLLTLFAAGQGRRTDLAVVVSPGCTLRDVSTVATSSNQGALTQITGVTRFLYLLRTGKDTGGAEIRLQFSPAPQDPSALLSFTTSLGGAGNSLSGNNIQVASPLVAATFGSNAHTTGTGESGAIEWTWQGPASALPTNAPAPALTIFCR